MAKTVTIYHCKAPWAQTEVHIVHLRKAPLAVTVAYGNTVYLINLDTGEGYGALQHWRLSDPVRDALRVIARRRSPMTALQSADLDRLRDDMAVFRAGLFATPARPFFTAEART